MPHDCANAVRGAILQASASRCAASSLTPFLTMSTPQRIAVRCRVAVLAGLCLTAACGPSNASSAGVGRQTRDTASSVAAPTGTSGTASSDTNRLVVYKSPTCGCCSAWVDHVRAEGFTVDVHDLASVDSVKDASGVPAELRSCHTAHIAGYAIEGHVPASDIRRFLRERPQVAGLAVPGMPMGSPGMEGAYKDRYDVLTFGGGTPSRVYASH